MKLDKGYEVEWCSEIPKDENGDRDIDAAKYHTRDFKTRALAINFAKTVLPQDQFGSVRVTQFEMKPYEETFPNGPTFREYTSDSEYIDE